MPALQASLKSSRHDQRFSLNWSYLEAIAGGVSAIALGSLALRQLSDAKQFAREYGYDLDQPAVRAYCARIHREAVGFVRETFLSADQRGEIPSEVADAADPLQLLLMASCRTHCVDPRRLWACAVLKVMHGLFYIDSNLKLRHFEAIRQQVFDGLDAVLRREGEQHWLTDGEVCLPLVHVEHKRNKSRHSILLKLLQKPEYVAADIHDHLGLRLTLNTRMECLLALDLLRRAHVVALTNLEVSRTRNSLLDLTLAKQVFKRYRALIDRASDYPLDLLRQMDQELAELSARRARNEARQATNPHTASDFHSLQLTVRKMIHLPDTELSPAIEGLLAEPPDVSFFFAFEIQLIDAASLAHSQDGESSHEAYKRRQVSTARRRVLGPELLSALRPLCHDNHG